MGLYCSAPMQGQMVVKIVPPELEEFLSTNSCEVMLINRNDSCFEIFLSLSLVHENDSCEWKQVSEGFKIPSQQQLDVNWDTLNALRENDCVFRIPLKGLYELQVRVKEKHSRNSIAVDRLQMYFSD